MNSPPDFDPLAAQAAAFNDVLDRSGTVVVERSPERRSTLAPASSSDLPADAWLVDNPQAQQACDRDDERVVADPEIDQPATIIRVGNAPPQPVEILRDSEPFDPTGGEVERVQQRHHLEQPEPSTDRFAGSSFDPLAGQR